MRYSILVLFASFSTLLSAAPLSKNLIGSYVDAGDTKRCFSQNAEYDIFPLTISKDSIEFGTEAGCTIKKASLLKKNIFKLNLECSSEGETYSQSVQLEETKTGVRINGTSYERCSSNP